MTGLAGLSLRCSEAESETSSSFGTGLGGGCPDTLVLFTFSFERIGEKGRAGELRSSLPAAMWLSKTLLAPAPDSRTAETTAGAELLPPRPGPLSVLLREVGVRLAGGRPKE